MPPLQEKKNSIIDTVMGPDDASRVVWAVCMLFLTVNFLLLIDCFLLFIGSYPW